MTQFLNVLRRAASCPAGWIGWLGVLGLLALSGCAGAPGGSGAVDNRGVVARIAQSRWDAVVKGDIETAYGMMSPASRSVVTLEVFSAKTRLVTWKAATVGKVECAESDVCKVQVAATYSYLPRRGGLAKPVENEQILNETWRGIDGKWWYVHADAL